MNLIEFPGLGLKFNIDPVAFKFGLFEANWYGIIIALGFLVAFIIALKTAPKFGYSEDNVIDMLLIALPLAIICARIFFVIIFWRDFKSGPFIDTIKIWEGGLSIYGGIIGGVLGGVIYSKYKKLNILDFLDTFAPLVLIGQAIGRWGNFINQEIYGKATNSFIRMTGSRIIGAVHPTFLYESILNLIAFFVLVKYRYKKKFKGEVICLYITTYSLIRFILEFIRVDMEGYFKANQVFALVLMIVFGAIIIIGRTRKKDVLEEVFAGKLNNYSAIIEEYKNEVESPNIEPKIQKEIEIQEEIEKQVE